ncbi:MAG: RNA polymerase sporulation sigma factor SigK [Lachnospiraceae bacterium]|nr:RNA polymerase sporulation sigma factor SigK [Lachnospiraceae bacterium]
MKTFQQPLTAPEESKYLEELKGKDKEAAKEAKRILIERNLRLVAHIAKKYQVAEEDTEDLISVGTIGLIKAIDSYDTEKGNKLVTYAARCIDNELLMLMRGRKKFSQEVSLYEPIGTDKEGNEIHLLDICQQEQEDACLKMETQEAVSRIKMCMNAVLDERERQILTLRFGLAGGEELTQREIGRMLGISRSYVSRIEKKGLEKLRDAYEG